MAVVGDIDAKALRARLDQLFGDLPQKQALAPVPDVTPKRRADAGRNALPQTSLQLAFPAMGRNDPEFYAGQLMNDIVGGSRFTSRLFQEVREKRGLAYGVSSSLEDYQPNMLVVATSTRADRAAETLDLIRQLIKELVDTGPTAAELEASKKYLIGAYAYRQSGFLQADFRHACRVAARQTRHRLHPAPPGPHRAGDPRAGRAAAKKLLSAEPAIMGVGP